MLRRAHPSHPPSPGIPVLLLACALPLVASGCGEPSPEAQEADREGIQDFLEDYLPALAEAYRTGDVDILDPYAAEKEQASIARRVDDLGERGEVLAPELVSVQVEDVTSWAEVNAYVTTVEVWNIRTYATGSENVVREELGQTNRVKYQLQRDARRWRVFWREIQETY
ncbi:MAG: hypothetical protein ACLF0P_03310 [Thermoanaerobaculia bacterium]